MTDSIQALIWRKMIHIVTIILPILYQQVLDREQILLLCGILSTGFLTVDLMRFKFRGVQNYFIKIFGSLLKAEERTKQITGATHLFIATTIVIYLFDKKCAIPALFILTLADAGAAIAGTLIGKHRLFRKTWEGSLTFFLISMVILMNLTELAMMSVVLAGIVLSVLEALPLPVNDNYTITAGSAIICSLVI